MLEGFHTREGWGASEKAEGPKNLVLGFASAPGEEVGPRFPLIMYQRPGRVFNLL